MGGQIELVPRSLSTDFQNCISWKDGKVLIIFATFKINHKLLKSLQLYSKRESNTDFFLRIL